MFETVVDIKQPSEEFVHLQRSAENFDGLNFLAGQEL